MFEQSTLEKGPAGKRAWTTFAGFGTQVLIVGSMILVPLVSPQVLPSVRLIGGLDAPGPPPGPPPKNPVTRVAAVRQPPSQINKDVLFEPVSRPAVAMMIVDPPPAASSSTGPGVEGGIGSPGAGGGGGGALIRDILGGVPRPAEPVRAPASNGPAAAPERTIPRYIQGGLVKPAVLVHRVDPPYPPLAKAAHISGDVLLEGVIGVNGRMIELRIVSGHPLLVKAAYDAVRQWIYRPTTLNGDAVEVIAPITVSFRLN